MRYYYPLLIVVFLLLLAQTGQAEETRYGLLWTNQGSESVAISSDGSYIATSSDEGLLIFNQEGKLLHKYEQGRRAEDISISSDGSYIVSQSYKRVCLFNRDEGLLWEKRMSESVDVSISPNASYIAVVEGAEKVHLLNKDGDFLWSYDIGTDGALRFSKVSISSDGNYVTVGSDSVYNSYYFGNLDNWYIKVYFLNREGRLLWSHKMKLKEAYVHDVKVSSNGSHMAVAADKNVYVFNREGEILWIHETYNRANSVSISSDGLYVAVGSSDDKVYLLDREGQMLWSYKTKAAVNKVSVFSDGLYIVAGSQDGNVYFFNRGGDLLWSYKTGGVQDVSVSSDSSSIAIAASGVYFFSNFDVVSNLVDKAKNVVESEKLKGFDMDDAESLLSQANQALKNENYEIAYDLAKEAKSHALDIDQDGISNDTDFNPTINNYLIYAGTIVILIGSIITLRTGLKKLNKVRLKRQHLAEVKHMKGKAKGLYQESMKQEILDMIEEATTSAPSNHPPQPQEILDMIEDVTEEGG